MPENTASEPLTIAEPPDTAFDRDIRRRVMLRAALEDIAIVDRFWSKVDQSAGPDACWPWTGSRDTAGYGQFMVRYGFRLERAHRFAWAFSARRLMSMDRMACHTCDTPPCCNPRHIYAGTGSQNSRDARDRERMPWVRFTREQVDEVRADTTSRTVDLATKWGTSRGAIDGIRSGRRWRD